MAYRKLKKQRLGELSKQTLLFTLPIVLLEMIGTLAFLLGKDTYEILAQRQTILSAIESIGISLLLSFGGCFLFDLVEKKEKAGEK